VIVTDSFWTDSFWTDDDYCAALEAGGWGGVVAHHPLAPAGAPGLWREGQTTAPCTVYQARRV
jgi:hypothetical protein